MKIPFIYQRSEGTECLNGINWNRSWNTRLEIVIKLGRLYLYFRLRSNKVRGRRFVWSIDWSRKYIIGRCIEFEFDTMSLIINHQRISVEFLEDADWKKLQKIQQKIWRRENV